MIQMIITAFSSSLAALSRWPSPSVYGQSANIVRLKPIAPVLIVEHGGDELPSLGRGFQDAGFTNPVMSLPDDRTVGLYLDGVGIYSNRKKYPLPVQVLQDITLPKLEHGQALPWLQELPQCRHIVITYVSVTPDIGHFESAVPFGPNAILCKLQHADSLDAMFRSLHRACIED